MEIAVIPLVVALALLAGLLWVAWKILKGVFWCVGRLFLGIGILLSRVFSFVRREIVEVARLVGTVVTGAVLLPILFLNLLLGRWGAGGHYARAIEDELTSGLLGIWRIAVANPLRLVGLSGMLEGVEHRIPDVVERAPRSRARARADALEFPGYNIVGSLPAGGSGAVLYLAQPEPETFQRFARSGRDLPAEVVIKSFALVQGSTLPQIVRESRALEAAGRLGLVYEHHLDDERFWYVMRYVRGENMDTALQRLHARSGVEGLAPRELALVLGYAQDLLRALDRFHTGGLWHKDVKPANLIVAPAQEGPSRDGSRDRVHLVDFGLVTPLSSAMTLTTHGTEYYRDPEMVRLAMQGVKVHEVDGVKFDLYSAGAVLYSMVENSFPAHGSLSRLTKRCPEALAWIIRRAMADIAQRYSSASEMLADLAALAATADPFALRPADLPSVRAGAAAEFVDEPADEEQPAGTLEPRPAAAAASSGRRRCRLTGPERPITPGRRKFRRALLNAARVVLFVNFFDRGFAAFFERAFARGGSRFDAARLEHQPLGRTERAALERAREVLSVVAQHDRVHAPAARWNERLSTLVAARQKRGEAKPRALLFESPASPVGAAEREALALALAAKGFEVLGVGDGDEPAEIEFLAGARRAAELSEPLDEEALARMQSYLESTKELDAIVWVAGTSAKEEPILRVLTRGGSRTTAAHASSD